MLQQTEAARVKIREIRKPLANVLTFILTTRKRSVRQFSFLPKDI